MWSDRWFGATAQEGFYTWMRHRMVAETGMLMSMLWKLYLHPVIFQITVGVDVSILDGKSVLKMLSLFFCHKSNLGACIASTGQTFSKKFEA